MDRERYTTAHISFQPTGPREIRRHFAVAKSNAFTLPDDRSVLIRPAAGAAIGMA